jgi:hypothetical protein
MEFVRKGRAMLAPPKDNNLLSYRSSQWFIKLTVAIAVFTDIFLYALIVPVMPFSLSTRTETQPQDSE